MATYIFRELQNANSFCQGEKIKTSTLTSAKRVATRRQVFCGTVLTIETEGGDVLARKSAAGKWVDLNQWGVPDHLCW